MWHVISNLLLLLLVVPQLAMGQIVDRNKNSFLKALPRNSCKVYEEHQVSNPPMERDQGFTNFCPAFAATYLLDHYLCKTEKRKCGDPATSLSVLDVMNNTTNKISEVGGNGTEVLIELSGKKGIATEACAPFSNLSSRLGNEWPEKSDKVFRNLENIYKIAKKKVGCTSSGAVSGVSNLQVSAAEFQEAIRQPDFKSFLGKVVVPSQCAEKGMAIPPFKLNTIAHVPFLKSKAAVNNQLRSEIRADNPILFSFCLTDDCSMGHVTVIHGYRETCCKGKLGEEKCSAQYMLYDTARTFAEKPGEIWLSADTVFEMADALRKNGESNRDVFGAFSFIAR